MYFILKLCVYLAGTSNRNSIIADKTSLTPANSVNASASSANLPVSALIRQNAVTLSFHLSPVSALQDSSMK